MTMHPVILVIFIVCAIFQAGLAAPTAQNFDSMEWTTGDIITCRLNGIWGTLFAKHYMLAMDENNVINIVGDKSSNEGTILKQNREEASGFNRSECMNKGTGKLPVKEAIERALNWKNRQVYYDLLRCNCEHWVEYWADGTSGGFFHNQSGLPTNSKCAI